MWFRLALAFGVPVGELSERMTSAEFTYWCAFYQLEPFGCEVDDFRSAMVATVTANAAGGKKGGKPFKVSEFMPKRRKRQSIVDQRKSIEAFLDGQKRRNR